VADRGMTSAATIQALEERKLEYLLGARERGTAVIRDIVLAGETPPLLGRRALFYQRLRAISRRHGRCS
jgi:hypothetical protein